MTTPPPDTPAVLQLNLPPEQEAGVYANFAAVWHDEDGFTLDFAIRTSLPQMAQDDSGATMLVVPARVVSRVRIPASQAWELMRALNTQLGQWEAEKAARPEK